MDVKTVKWYVENKNMISFVEDEDAYFLEEKVVKFLGENVPQEDEKYEVEFGKDSEGIPTVSKLKKVNADTKTKKTETKTDTVETTNEEVKTVGGISYKNGGMVFEEEKDVWYDFTESDVKGTGIKRGVKVAIVTKPQEGKKNKLITSIRMVEDKKETKSEEPKKVEKTTEEPKKETTSYVKKSNNPVQDSIEAQAAVNCANNSIAVLFAGKLDKNDPDDAKLFDAMVANRARKNFDLVQELKNR